MSYLYIISSNLLGPVKLGFSKNPDKRLKQLQTANADKLSIYHTEYIEECFVKQAENELHCNVGYKRMTGEWFNLSVEEAITETTFVGFHY